MHAIALLLAIAATGQHPDQPPPLDNNETSYAIDVEGETWYVRVKGAVGELEKEGYFKSDEPIEKFVGWQTLSFEAAEKEPNRNERWRKQVEELNTSAGFVRATFADGNDYWVPGEDARLAERARAAALEVMQAQEALESITPETSTVAPVQDQSAQSPGLLALWGPQIAVAGLALVLMGVVIKICFIPDGTGWEKID